ncbi:uncharacterized protein LOC129576360 isoform X1 [Sitodiplosis mosellana]|uniref:uncharacterized protein LOC129576360 isoform X1 n=1 Tax=Sitodiplosis mosellana TaxID=263140 RepID=UPI002445166C|nr:uncharacterized protein LOC129576360 isoform X1 [Sitodiplosis mosellana]
MDSSNSTDQGFAGSSSYSGTPAKRPRNESPPPGIGRSTFDLHYKNGDLFATIGLAAVKATLSSEIERNVNKLNRFLIAVNLATEVLEKIRGLIKEMERADDGSVGTETYESPTQLQNAKFPPSKQSKKSKHTRTSSSAIFIAAFLRSIGQFLGVAMNEITVCAKARPAESVDPAKKERLKRLSSHTEVYLDNAMFKRQRIEKAIAQIDPNYKPKPNLVQSDTENAIIKMVREKPSTLEPIIIALKANGYLPEN